MNWNNRSKITTTAKAIEALADFLSSSGGIHSAMKDELDEAASIAEKWDIPFDRKLVSKMISQMNSKRWSGDTDSLAEQLGIDRDDYKSDEDFEDDLEAAKEKYENDYYYEPMADHTWMSSSETAQC